MVWLAKAIWDRNSHYLIDLSIIPASESREILQIRSVLHKPVTAIRLFEALDYCLSSKEVPLCLGDMYFFPKERVLSIKKNALAPEDTLKLTEKEAALLYILYSHRDAIVSKEALLAQVWNYAPGMDTHTVETHIYRLRQKIADFALKKILLRLTLGGIL